MRVKHIAKLIGVVGIVVFCLIKPSFAIVVSDNLSNNNHVVIPPSAFDMVGKLPGTAGGVTTGVLIDPWHVLTVKHAVKNYSSGTFVLNLTDGEHTYSWSEKSLHPTADLAVLTLATSTGLSGYPLYDLSNEFHKDIIMVGYGVSGVGAPDKNNYPKGVTDRFGYNIVDGIATDENGIKYLASDFDDNGSDVMMADGDSGGPSFIDVGGTYYIAGIHHGVTDNDDDGIYPEYGDLGYDVRVSEYRDWISQQVPEPITILLFATGLGLIRKRNHLI